MQNKSIQSYKDLIVWQKSMQLTVLIYKLTEKFPKSEIYGLTSQMRRCSISIPSNIAEGSRRSTKKDYSHFMSIAFGSGSELETQIEITKRLFFVKNLDFTKIDSLLNEIMRMLNKMISNLNN
jgi:four helix bundle protein